MAWVRGVRARIPGGQPTGIMPSLRVPCSDCEAEVGERCRVFRREGGVRLYVRGHRVKPHPERIAAARNGAA